MTAKTAAQTAKIPRGMRASLTNTGGTLDQPDPRTPIYNAVLADLTKPKRRAAKTDQLRALAAAIEEAKR